MPKIIKYQKYLIHNRLSGSKSYGMIRCIGGKVSE